MTRRRTGGNETFVRLRDWSRGQAPAERLAAQLLRVEGFTSIDPSHPLGGPDGLKDVLCKRDGIKWIGAAYFPRGQQSFNAIADKFTQDLAGVETNKVDGFVFITNQELKLGERDQLRKSADGIKVELLHLERGASILDSPQCYGIRLEFLDIEMTKEEQLAYIAGRDAVIERLRVALETIVSHLQNLDLLKNQSLKQIRASIPLSEIKEFKFILDTIVGFNPFTTSISPLGVGIFTGSPGHIGNLQVPLTELKEFADILDRIAGYRDRWMGVTGLETSLLGGTKSGHIRDLHVPIVELQEYEATLDRVIRKLQKKKRLEAGYFSMFQASGLTKAWIGRGEAPRRWCLLLELEEANDKG